MSKYIALPERETGNELKMPRTDNGLEFINDEGRDLVEKVGSHDQCSVLYSPKQNGRGELKIRTFPNNRHEKIFLDWSN